MAHMQQNADRNRHETFSQRADVQSSLAMEIRKQSFLHQNDEGPTVTHERGNVSGHPEKDADE